MDAENGCIVFVTVGKRKKSFKIMRDGGKLNFNQLNLLMPEGVGGALVIGVPLL